MRTDSTVRMVMNPIMFSRKDIPKIIDAFDVCLNFADNKVSQVNEVLY
jgi:hypothetical protein